jgi:hypothetical protein
MHPIYPEISLMRRKAYRKTAYRKHIGGYRKVIGSHISKN